MPARSNLLTRPVLPHSAFKQPHGRADRVNLLLNRCGCVAGMRGLIVPSRLQIASLTATEAMLYQRMSGVQVPNQILSVRHGHGFELCASASRVRDNQLGSGNGDG